MFVVVAQIRWIAWSTSIAHSRTVWSTLPVAYELGDLISLVA
ncbi:MAG: hypothetical protein ACRDRI_12575 [Pseudonocardiaceae bacterium]